MHIVTDYLLPNEPCYGAAQGPRLIPLPDGSQQWRWLEWVFVIRGDAIAKWEKDHGPAENFKGMTETRDPLDGELSVQEVQEMMVQDRTDHYWQDKLPELRAQSTLMKDAMDQLEERRAIIHNRTVSGPGGTRQRNGFSPQAIQRIISQKRQDYTGIVPRRQR